MRCSVSVGGLNLGYWYTKTWPDFSESDLKFYLVIWPSSSNRLIPMPNGYLNPQGNAHEVKLLWGCPNGGSWWIHYVIFIEDLDKGYYLWNHLHAGRLFWFGCYRKISFWAISDVISVSILECHWIQAIIASSLNIFVIIINCERQVVDWVVRTCSSFARIWAIVQYPLLQSSMFPGSP